MIIKKKLINKYYFFLKIADFISIITGHHDSSTPAYSKNGLKNYEMPLNGIISPGEEQCDLGMNNRSDVI